MSTSLSCTSPRPSSTFGGVLQSLLGTIVHDLRSVHKKHPDALPERALLAQRLSFALGVLKHAKADCMLQTLYKIPAETREVFDEFETIALCLQAVDSFATLGLQEKLEALKTTHRFTHVTDVQLAYRIIKDTAQAVIVKVSGEFDEHFQAYMTTSNKPALNIDGVPCPFHQASRTEMTFRIPNCVLHNKGSHYKLGQAHLIVPVELTGKFRHWLHCDYAFPIMALPDTPGEVTVEFESGIKKFANNHSRAFQMDLKEPVETYSGVFTLYPSTGYIVDVCRISPRAPDASGIPNPGTPSITAKIGTISQVSWELKPNKIECSVTVKASPGSSLNRLDFIIDFNQVIEEIAVSRVESHTLAWGHSKLFKPHFGERIGHVAFRGFGTCCRVTSPEDLKLPYIRAKKTEDSWTISVDKPLHELLLRRSNG